jgi:hypothetical protein
MRVVFHPEFPRDQRKFEAVYADISAGLSARFRDEIEGAIAAIKAGPAGGGHFLNPGTGAVREFRRRNLEAFPFFVLYGWTDQTLIFGAIVPARSDPLTWLTRFAAP